MLDINDIRKGVELLDKKDETLWNADGSPKLEAVQNIVGDEVTQAALTQAISPEPEQTQPAWVSIHDNSEEHRGEEDINETKLRRAAEASAIRDTLVPELHEMQIARDALDKDIARHRAAVNDLSKTIHDNTVHISEAEMIKKIQAQTQEKLMRQHEAQKKITEIMKEAGIRSYASPLDQTLHQGGKRSVVLVDGKPYVAPHPRSEAGIRSYANWIHNGQRQTP